jgi:uncharacterized membrane protein
MTAFMTILVVATFLSALVAGLLFVFAVVVMPGIGSLSDRDFIRAFQVIDRVVQNNQPLFLLVWVGSAVAVLVAAVLGVWHLGGIDRWLVIGAAVIYVIGVQAPTITINVPLNDTLQRLDVSTMSEPARQQARLNFEPRWNQWNVVRTVCASLTSALLMIVILKV